MESGLNLGTIIVACTGIVLWGLLSSRLERADITGPIAFVLLGLVAAHGPVSLAHVSLSASQLRTVVEITLAVVLFSDAARIDLRALRGGFGVPLRLLAIGLPLTIGIGTGLAIGLLGSAGIWVAALIGASLAPTDAALSASIIQDERIPASVRRSLNIESGLNDGIATPFVNVFLAGALSAEAAKTAGVGQVLLDLLGGAGIGIGIGALGAVLLLLSRRSKWGSAEFRPLAVLALGLLAYTTALEAGTNGFVAAFLGGLAFGAVTRNEAPLLTFTDEAGELLSLLVWFAFGAAILVPGFEWATWGDVAYAALVLTVARMVPVGLSLVGTGLDRATVALIGWFGPRGLASVVFGLIAFDSLDRADAETVIAAVAVTVTMSVAAHGLSASPLAQRYAGHARRARLGTPGDATEIVLRPRSLNWRRRGTAPERRLTAKRDGRRATGRRG